jgi:polysaccharide biosynthesis/export protein
MRTDHLSPLWVASLIVLLPAGVVAVQQPAVTIAPRDQLTISVWNGGVNEPDYSGRFPVDIDGTFEYPTVGKVKAGGLTVQQVEASLKTLLEKYLVSPQVTIEVEQTTNKKVVINGEVRLPAAYAFAGQMTLFEALTRAGSVTDEAGDEAVIYRRAGTGRAEPITVDLHDLLTSLKDNVVLEDGDMVIVPKAEPAFITGFVQSPGPVRVRRGLTVQQALSMAGGVTERGSTKGIRIQRMVNGKKKEIKVNDITTEVVQPGDTIVVRARIL